MNCTPATCGGTTGQLPVVPTERARERYLYVLSSSVEVLIDRLQPSSIIVGVAHDVHVQFVRVPAVAQSNVVEVRCAMPAEACALTVPQLYCSDSARSWRMLLLVLACMRARTQGSRMRSTRPSRAGKDGRVWIVLMRILMRVICVPNNTFPRRTPVNSLRSSTTTPARQGPTSTVTAHFTWRVLLV
jgi:hypothetical protein